MDRHLDSFVSASGSYCMFKARWEIDCRRMKHMVVWNIEMDSWKWRKLERNELRFVADQ